MVFLKTSDRYKMKKTTLTVAVSGLNNTDNPGPGVPFIRAIRESAAFDVRVVGLAYENLEPGIYMPGMVQKTFLMPYPSEGKDAVLQRIAHIQKQEDIQVLVPNFDSELHTFMLCEKELEAMGIRTFLPTLEQYEERHKWNLPEFGEKYDVEVPKSVALNSGNEIERVEEEFDFPVMVKGLFYDAYIAYTIDQVRNHFNRISAKWGFPVIVQEFVKGTEVNVIALGDGTGRTVGAVPMRKQYITDKGKAWGGITLDAPVMMELTRRIIEKTRWRGGMELELIRTADNRFYLIEINPRLPAWLYLAVGAGQNLPEALLKLALGMEVKSMTQYDIGRMFVRYSYDMIVNIEQFQQISVNGEL